MSSAGAGGWLAAGLLLLGLGEVRAQVYFDLPPEAVRAKALKAGFSLAHDRKEAGHLQLVFRKREDTLQALICDFNAAEYCTRFTYRLPLRFKASTLSSLNQRFTRKADTVWENKAAGLQLELREEPGLMQLIYTPLQP